MIKYLFEAPFLCCINYLEILSKYTTNEHSGDSTHVSFQHHITHFTTQQPSSQNYSQYYYDQLICFANPSVPSHRKFDL